LLAYWISEPIIYQRLTGSGAYEVAATVAVAPTLERRSQPSLSLRAELSDRHQFSLPGLGGPNNGKYLVSVTRAVGLALTCQRLGQRDAVISLRDSSAKEPK
jgi:hypothetical protein